LIAETIDVIAVLAGRGNQRRLIELVGVEGLHSSGDYVLAPAASACMKGDGP
jgi:type IV secretion system protein VirB11